MGGNDPTASAAEAGSEDGSDPKRFHDRRSWNDPRRPGRKARQLCGQVADALRVILPGLADEVLQNLTVVAVEPAPHTGRLLVTVAGFVPTDVTDRDTAAEHLAHATGRIRSEVASAVHRRKAPELVFAVV
jgi:ribosome-binding factor A